MTFKQFRIYMPHYAHKYRIYLNHEYLEETYNPDKYDDFECGFIVVNPESSFIEVHLLGGTLITK